MVRFKVVRGSHLLLALSAFILAAVLAFIIIQGISGDPSIQHSQAEAKAFTAFASNPSQAASLQIEILAYEDKNDGPPLAGAPSILIYHTHTHEAYEQVNNSPYNAIEAWRTEDEQYSVVRVGALLRDELAKRGYFVVHDTTDHEQNDINLAYKRSLKTLESYSVPFDLVIDLHRDAYSDSMQMRLNDGDAPCAQIMLLVGDGGEYQGDDAPDYERNLSFAHRLTSRLNQIKNGIARNVTVKKGRYNQHIGEAAALIEVGHNKNTLEEALNSVSYLAEAIDHCLKQIYPLL